MPIVSRGRAGDGSLSSRETEDARKRERRKRKARTGYGGTGGQASEREKRRSDETFTRRREKEQRKVSPFLPSLFPFPFSRANANLSKGIRYESNRAARARNAIRCRLSRSARGGTRWMRVRHSVLNRFMNALGSDF